MVAEQPWVIPKKKKKGWMKNPVVATSKVEKIGILSFEVANAMSKAISLHKSLSKSDICKLYSDILNCHAIRTMVSTDESYLLHLVLAEKLDELNRVAALVSRLGRWRCTEQALVGFEHVYGDLLKGRIEVGTLAFLVKDMERTVKKMERYVSSTAALYGELGVLNELEQGVRKQQRQLAAQHLHDETRRSFEQKIQWQRQDVRHLRDTSLWNQDYDKIVGLMARAVCTIYTRIRVVFGGESTTINIEKPLSSPLEHRRMVSSRTFPLHHYNSHRRQISGSSSPRKERQIDNHLHGGTGPPTFACGTSPGRLFMGCLNLTSSATSKDNDDNRENLKPSFAETTSIKSHPSRRSYDLGNGGGFPRYGPKSRVTTHAPPSTVGASALALHYANIVIIIEKFLRYPHLIGEEARDDLYQMLPVSLRISLRKSLESYVKNLAIYDAPLAHEWKETLAGLLVWLAPMAHNMILWQAERNFEQQQQQIGVKTNVLLVQTLYFVDREKLEKLICELLVGLNYICRYEHQQNALLDCGSVDFDECADWQLNY